MKDNKIILKATDILQNFTFTEQGNACISRQSKCIKRTVTRLPYCSHTNNEANLAVEILPCTRH